MTREESQTESEDEVESLPTGCCNEYETTEMVCNCHDSQDHSCEWSFSLCNLIEYLLGNMERFFSLLRIGKHSIKIKLRKKFDGFSNGSEEEFVREKRIDVRYRPLIWHCNFVKFRKTSLTGGSNASSTAASSLSGCCSALFITLLKTLVFFFIFFPIPWICDTVIVNLVEWKVYDLQYSQILWTVYAISIASVMIDHILNIFIILVINEPFSIDAMIQDFAIVFLILSILLLPMVIKSALSPDDDGNRFGVTIGLNLSDYFSLIGLCTTNIIMNRLLESTIRNAITHHWVYLDSLKLIGTKEKKDDRMKLKKQSMKLTVRKTLIGIGMNATHFTEKAIEKAKKGALEPIKSICCLKIEAKFNPSNGKNDKYSLVKNANDKKPWVSGALVAPEISESDDIELQPRTAPLVVHNQPGERLAEDSRLDILDSKEAQATTESFFTESFYEHLELKLFEQHLKGLPLLDLISEICLQAGDRDKKIWLNKDQLADKIVDFREQFHQYLVDQEAQLSKMEAGSPPINERFPMILEFCQELERFVPQTKLQEVHLPHVSKPVAILSDQPEIPENDQSSNFLLQTIGKRLPTASFQGKELPKNQTHAMEMLLVHGVKDFFNYHGKTGKFRFLLNVKLLANITTASLYLLFSSIYFTGVNEKDSMVWVFFLSITSFITNITTALCIKTHDDTLHNVYQNQKLGLEIGSFSGFNHVSFYGTVFLSFANLVYHSLFTNTKLKK